MSSTPNLHLGEKQANICEGVPCYCFYYSLCSSVVWIEGSWCCQGSDVKVGCQGETTETWGVSPETPECSKKGTRWWSLRDYNSDNSTQAARSLCQHSRSLSSWAQGCAMLSASAVPLGPLKAELILISSSYSPLLSWAVTGIQFASKTSVQNKVLYSLPLQSQPSSQMLRKWKAISI